MRTVSDRPSKRIVDKVYICSGMEHIWLQMACGVLLILVGCIYCQGSDKLAMHIPRIIDCSPSPQKGKQVVFVLLITVLSSVCASGQNLPFTQAFDPRAGKIEVDPTSNWGVFRASETVAVKTSDGSAIRVFDLKGTTVYQGSSGSLPSLPVGHYFIECPGDRSQFCVLPNDYSGAAFIGTDVSNGDQAYVERLAQIQPTWVRTFVLWSTIQPQSNVWDWSLLDAQVLANPGKRIVVVAFFRPAWVDDANFLPSYLNYIRQIAQRYEGRIYAIQIWNEPWLQAVKNPENQWGDIGNSITGNAEVDGPVFHQSLANLLQQSSAAIHSVSASIKAFGPDWNSPFHVPDTAAVAQYGGINPLDMFTFHGWSFGSPDSAVMTNQDGYTRYIDLIKPSLAGKPWMCSEFHAYGSSALGIPNQPSDPIGLSGINWHRGMCRVFKTVVMWLADGAQAVSQHVLPLYGRGDNPNYEIFGWEYAPPGGLPRGPHPKTSAYLMSAYWLKDATFVGKRTPGQKVYLYAYRRYDNTSLVFAWTGEGQSVNLKSSRSVRDIYGTNKQISALTEEPVFFSAKGSDALALLGKVMASLNENLNLPPSILPISTQSVRNGELLQFNVYATDPDCDPLKYSASKLPTGATLDPDTGLFSWTPSANQVGAYQVAFTVTDARGLSASVSTVINVLAGPSDGLAHYWKMDEGAGSVTWDSVDTNTEALVNCKFVGSSGWVGGIAGSALSFDGTDDYVSIDGASLNLTNNFTISAWVKPRDATDAGPVLAVRSFYQTSGFRIWVHSNMLLVEGETTAGWNYAWFAPDAFTNDTWTHIAIVYDKSRLNAFVNGVKQPPALGSIVDWGGDFIMNASERSSIGAEVGYFYFNGTIDEVMQFNRTLVAEEILALWRSGSGAPNSAPVLSPIGTRTTSVGQILAFSLFGTDAEGDVLTYTATGLPVGALFDTEIGAFTWTPQDNQIGSYDVTFSVSDGQLRDIETVTLTVAKPIKKPTLKLVKPKHAKAGRRVCIRLYATNPSHQPLTYSISPMPSGSTFDSVLRKFVWVTTNATTGTYMLSATVTDGTNSDTKPVSIVLY